MFTFGMILRRKEWGHYLWYGGYLSVELCKTKLYNKSEAISIACSSSMV
jgi:hypothetical protein